MAEANTTPRLMAAAKEFNIGAHTLIDFLVSKSFNSDDLKPTSKLTEEMYRVLQVEFQQDKAAKQKSDQIDLPKGPEAKKKKDEEDLSIKKKEEKAKKAAEPTPEEPKPQPKEEKKEIAKIEAPEIEQPKVIDKIDLSAIESSTRPKKAKATPAKKEEPVKEEEPEKKKKKTKEEAPKAEPVATPAPAPAPEVPPAPPVIENIQAQKISGPKIMGKIELPKESDTRPRKEEDKKRKRIPIQKKPGQSPAPTQGGNNYRGGGGGGRPQGGGGGRQHRNEPKREDKIIDEKEIQEKLRQTQAKLAGSSGRGKSLKAKYRKAKREEMAENASEGVVEGNKLQVTEFVSVSELANLMDVSFADVISKCMGLGIMVSINQRLEADVIELVAGEFGFEVEFIG